MGESVSLENSFHLALEEEDDGGLVGSQLPEAPSQATTGSWEMLERFENRVELVDFLYSYSHKMTATHCNQQSKCILHIRHKQSYGYLACASRKCILVDGDSCLFRLRVRINFIINK